MREETAAILDRAHDSLESAQVLLSSGHPCVSVSRSYYVMFYCAKALLVERGLMHSKHSAVIAAFGQHFAAAGILDRELHRYLREAFDARGEADYDYRTRLSPEEAAEHFRRAQQFLAAVELFLDPVGE